ncbi:hypothetical protein, partial [Vibrio cholerae]|uniref:hypothetical protein n=1 Tax=Vibrio cholerae TaxID=666 RepID=UPI0015A49838
RSDRSIAWKSLLRIAHESSCAREGGRIVLGGYALISANRETNARAFQNAWREWQQELLSQPAPTAHDPLRVAAVMLLATLIVD